jgi:hypothetical protein
VCICGAPAAARAESEDDPVWIDEVWPGLAAQLGQVVQAHAAGDGLPPREVQGKSNSTADLLRRCRGTATQRAWRIAWAACASAARPTSAGRGLTRSNSPGRFRLEDHWDSDRSSRSSSFSSPISNSSALWSSLSNGWNRAMAGFPDKSSCPSVLEMWADPSSRGSSTGEVSAPRCAASSSRLPRRMRLGNPLPVQGCAAAAATTERPGVGSRPEETHSDDPARSGGPREPMSAGSPASCR